MDVTTIKKRNTYTQLKTHLKGISLSDISIDDQ